MKRKNTSIFWTLPVDELKSIINNCTSLSQVFDELNLCKTGPQYKALKQRIEELNISTDHFVQRVMNGRCKKRPIEFYLKEGISCHTGALKLRLVKEGFFEYKCTICGNQGEHFGQPLSLQLDHINGNRNDNRLENLRILCPNCHTQTHNYSGKKLRKHFNACSICSKPINSIKNKQCKRCFLQDKTHPHLFQIKIPWPTKEILEKLVWEKPITLVAKDLGVSDNGVRKHCRHLNIKLPPMGYWQRINAKYDHKASLVSVKKIRPKLKIFNLDDLANIRNLLSQKVSCSKIAKLYKVSHSTIADIKNNKSYQENSKMMKIVHKNNISIPCGDRTH